MLDAEMKSYKAYKELKGGWELLEMYVNNR